MQTPSKDAINQLFKTLVNENFTLADIYTYKESNGLPIYWKARFINGQKKEIRPFSFVDGQWQAKEPQFSGDKPLYNQDVIYNNPKSTVWFVEGEKCADALINLGVIATTSGGANSTDCANLQILRNRHVIIWPDNDDPGINFSESISRKLIELNCKIEIIDVKQLNLSQKGDCVDWLEKNPTATKEDIEKLSLHDPLTKEGLEPRPDETPVSLDPISPPQITSDIFTGWLGDMIEAVSQATETPRELSAMIALAVLAACCQKKFIVEPEVDYQEPLNIWTLVALDPANRKSSVMKYMKAPLLNWEKEQAEKLKPEIQKATADRKTLEEKIKAMRKEASALKNPIELENLKCLIATEEANLPEIKSIPRVWAQDITPENLGVKMTENKEQLAIFSAEGGIFEIMAGIYNKKGMANIDIFLQAHAGDSVRVDRGSREPVFMSSPALTMGLSPQPAVLQSLAKTKEFRGKGLLARFLYAIPTSTLGYRELSASNIPLSTINQYSKAIFLLLNIENNQDELPYTLKFDCDAHVAWKNFAKQIEVELREGGRYEYIKDWAGKLVGATARIAGLFHCALHAMDNPAANKINKETALRAITLATILSEHALIAFDLIGTDPEKEKARKILGWIRRKRINQFTARDCFNDLRGLFGEMSELQKALEILVEHFYIYLVPTDQNIRKVGRPKSQTYSVSEKFEIDKA